MSTFIVVIGLIAVIAVMLDFAVNHRKSPSDS